MASFKLFEPILLKQEGGYSNDPADTGGETWEGISRKNYPKWAGWALVDQQRPLAGFPHNLRGIPALQNLVDAFYKCTEWDELLADQISNQSIANFMVDWEVNAGETAPIQHLQEILNIVPDGKMGPITLGALNKAIPTIGPYIFAQLQRARSTFYQAVVRAHPKDKKFLTNWIERTYSFKFVS